MIGAGTDILSGSDPGKWYYFSGANDNVVVVVPEHNAVVWSRPVVQPKPLCMRCAEICLRTCRGR